MAKRIFISFAVEDKWYRDALVQQAKDDRSPFEFTDYSVKEPWSTAWKTNCRQRIKGCDGVIALISKKTRAADGARWEMQCAHDEGIPMIGVHIHADDKGAVPSELSGHKVIDWSWPGMKTFIDGLK
jgi:hypothetical protein